MLLSIRVNAAASNQKVLHLPRAPYNPTYIGSLGRILCTDHCANQIRLISVEDINQMILRTASQLTCIVHICLNQILLRNFLTYHTGIIPVMPVIHFSLNKYL